MPDKPAAEVDIDHQLVKRLLEGQAPELAGRAIEPLSSGWDNMMWRLGSDLLIRLPRRELSAGLIVNEGRWLPELAPRLPIPIPAPIHIGQPADGYPWAWTIVPFFEGDAAAEHLPVAPQLARPLAEFLRALHQPSPATAPQNPYRGVSLRVREASFSANLAHLNKAIATRLDRVYRNGLAAPEWPKPPAWVHGDIHGGNLIINDGSWAAVIDFGDVCGGDPANDLSVAWLLFDAAGREQFRQAYSPGAALWDRAHAWAASICAVLLVHSDDDARMRRMGEFALTQVAGEIPPTL